MIFQNEFDDPNIETYTISGLRSDGSQSEIVEILAKNLYDMSSKGILASKTVVLDEQANKIEIFLKLENSHFKIKFQNERFNPAIENTIFEGFFTKQNSLLKI